MDFPTSTPPLLLTKRLTGFLHGNRTSSLPTLLLTTSHGKLLAHASPHPVTVLRTHATVAASLFSIHTSSSANLPSALPGARTPDPIGSSPPEEDVERGHHHRRRHSQNHNQNRHHHNYGYGTSNGGDSTEDDDQSSLKKVRLTKPVVITVQLSGGTVTIRRLKCGLLFVCVGPPASDGEHQQHHQQQHQQYLHPNDASQVGSPSEVDSMISMGAQTTASLESAGAAALVAMRRHAAEIAQLLDDRLDTLTVPKEGVGIE